MTLTLDTYPPSISVLSESLQQRGWMFSAMVPLTQAQKDKSEDDRKSNPMLIASALFTLKFNIFIELKAGYCTHPIKELSIYREVSCVLNHKTQFLFICLHFLNTK